MKKNFQKTSFAIIIFILISNSVSTTADYPTGTLIFSDDIAPGNSFTWIIDTLDIVGDWYENPDDFYIGDVRINESDEIKLEITEDPDTANDSWYDVYVNGILIPNPEPMMLGYIWVWYIYAINSYLLISPVEYVNATGTYGIYEQIFEEIQDNSYEDEYSYSSEISETTVEYIYSLNSSYSMDSDSFIIELYILYYERFLSSNYEESNVLEATIKTSVNINTGLLEEAKSFVNWEDILIDNGTIITYETGYSNFWMMEESYIITTTTPTFSEIPIISYLLTFSVISMIVIAITIRLIRRKRFK